MSTPTRFSDGQYKNWLKCSQSLIIMKEALHDYIDKEVKNLHGDITLKVSSIPCGSSTGNHCASCSSKNIKLTGGRHGNWNINCKNSICDKWLHEILAVHDDPHNPTINWKNADISMWPIDCYHVAKIFMPKGQDKTTKMPDDLDAPAILSLMKYCIWFRKDLPNTQILSDLIDIRNKVLHSGDLRVADSDKDSWIDLMIQLLSDLKIHGDAQAKLVMLKKEDIDINFRETEIRVLQKLVLSLAADLTTVKGDINSLQNSQLVLSKAMEDVRISATETTGKVDTVETDIEVMRKSLEELKIIYDKTVSFFDKNLDIHDKDIIETIRVIDMDVKDLQNNLFRVETELKASLEKHREETKEQIKQTRTWVEGIEKRVTASEEQLSLLTDTTRNKRPETEGLRQLKTQTENKLDTQRTLECIPTEQAEETKKLLAEKRSIVIKGNPGEGKTTLALHLIDNEMFRDKRVVLYRPRQWEKVDTDWVDIVVLENIFGQYDFDSGRLQEWMVYLPTIQEHVDAGKIQVIVTTRADVLSKAYSKLELLKLFSEDLSLTLSSEQLTNSEKISILNRELNRHKRHMKEDEKEVCIANFDGLIGFPQCCLLFAGDSKSFDRGPEFFRSPKKFFVANITALEAARFLPLAFLFCNGEILEENLSPETMPESSKQLLMELASDLHISKKAVSITLLRDVYDNFLELYVVKSMSYDFNLEKSSIIFTHDTVYEAVGQVLGDRCIESVVRYSSSEYLYQRTYTADVKDGTSEKVFIPVYVYGLLAKRMVHNVVTNGLVRSVVKHSALKNHEFLMKLKYELHQSNVTEDFFNAESEHSTDSFEERCPTFMELILQSDKDVVSLVYRDLLEFLGCAHNNNISNCWKCREKQNLLQLALYYHHFEIADKLIAMNACYTHESLSNAARHGDLKMVQSILETLKKNRVFSPKDDKFKYELFRAYTLGNQSLIELLLKEGIILDSWHVVDASQHGDMDVLIKVVEHLKCHNKWNPDREQQWIHQEDFTFSSLRFCLGINTQCSKSEAPCSKALYITYCNEKFDMADYLMKNEVKVEMPMLDGVLLYSSTQAAFRVIQDLKHAGTWDPHCDAASEALVTACSRQMYDVYNLLVQDGVPLKMEYLPSVLKTFNTSLENDKKAIQYLKDNDNWDPTCDDASKVLEAAICRQKYDVYDLLVQDGVSLKMKNLLGVIKGFGILDDVKKAIQHLKDNDNWDPKCDDASQALATAICRKEYDIYDLLVQHGVSLKMKNLPDVMSAFQISLDDDKKVIQHMKDTDNWDPKCDDASKVLENAICRQKDDVYNLLVQNGVSLKMKNLPSCIRRHMTSKPIKKAIQHLKDTDNWDPKCDDASKALETAICEQKYNVYNLLIQDGVSLKMKNLPSIMGVFILLEDVKKVIQHLKATDNWDPKCDDASKALEAAICEQDDDVYDLLVQDGVSLKMKNLPGVIMGFGILDVVKKAIQHLKDNDNWDPKCDDASQALETAICRKKYDIYDLLVQDGVSLKIKNLPGVMSVFTISLDDVKKVIQDMKATDNWDPKCDDASKVLEDAICRQKDDVYNLLVQDGVPLKMKSLLGVIMGFGILDDVKKAIQHLKDNDNWDPKCDDASQALETAICRKKYDIYDLLVQDGVSLKMKNLPGVMGVFKISLNDVKKVIQDMKATDNWDPKCDDASKVLEDVICRQKDDVYNLLVQDGVSLKMKNLLGVIMGFGMLDDVKKAIQHLKDNDNWDPKCDDASQALATAICRKKYDIYDLLVQDGVLLKMKNLPGVISVFKISLDDVKKVIQDMKATDNWDPKCDDASKALEAAICRQKYDVYDLLVQDGVSLKMKNLLGVIMGFGILDDVKKAIQHLKDNDNWDPKCDDASQALATAICRKKYNIYDLLVQDGVSLKMKNLPGVMSVFKISLDDVKKVIQDMKATDNWDPKCDDASKVLEAAICEQDDDVYDLLVQDGVSLKMKNLLGVIKGFGILDDVKKAIQHLKNNGSWDPKCDDASKALEASICVDDDDVYDLLVQDGVSLKMKNLLGVITGFQIPLEYFKKAIQHLKDNDMWDPNDDDVIKAYEALVQDEVSLKMQTLPGVIMGFQISMASVKKAIQHLKDTDNWDPKCDDASKALEAAVCLQKYDVYDLLIQDGVSLKMINLLSMIMGFEDISLGAVAKALEHLKATDNWDPHCYDASAALSFASCQNMYDVVYLLVQEGVLLNE